MFSKWRTAFSANENGSAVAEFGVIASAVVLLSVIAVEFILVVFDYSRATEATRAATRMAVMMTPVGNLNTLDTDDVVCTGTAGGATCTGGAVLDVDTFTTLVTRMQSVLPKIQPENVTVEYKSSGVGAADSGGYKPYVSVKLTNLQHNWLLIGAFIGEAASITYPTFSTTLLGNSYEPV